MARFVSSSSVFSTVLLASALLGISVSRPEAARMHAKADELEDLFALPSPEHLKVASMGYRSALADLIFADTLVTAGQHFSAKKVFEHLDRYLLSIIELEPRFHTVYFYADSMLTLSTVEMPDRNWRIAREIQERGLAHFPDDAGLWMSAGQFIAYLAPQRIPDTEDKQEWRVAGARIIGHACSIWPSDERPPVSCLGHSRLLKKAGETEAMINSLERLIMVTKDEMVRVEAAARLEQLLSENQKALFHDRINRLSQLRQRDLPLTSSAAYQLIGPRTKPSQCIGLSEVPTSVECSSSFSLWSEASDRLRADRD